jgi:hypothetical protein
MTHCKGPYESIVLCLYGPGVLEDLASLHRMAPGAGIVVVELEDERDPDRYLRLDWAWWPKRFSGVFDKRSVRPWAVLP